MVQTNFSVQLQPKAKIASKSNGVIANFKILFDLTSNLSTPDKRNLIEKKT